jgi:hypothetical protein
MTGALYSRDLTVSAHHDRLGGDDGGTREEAGDAI